LFATRLKLDLRLTHGHLDGDVLVLGSQLPLGANHIVETIENLSIGHVSKVRMASG
jgi:hypothetical protein